MNLKKSPLILAVDTSCDETAASVIKGFKVLSNVISSQVELHNEFGGVVPSIAKREHSIRIYPVMNRALRNASKLLNKNISFQDLDALAVTYGPGLAIALEVGIKTIIELAKEKKKPVIAVNHMAGHLYSVLGLNSKGEKGLKVKDVKFPVLAFLLSGGHTELILLKNFQDFEIVGRTLDDAVGEAYDKVARMLGLGYPGGSTLTDFAKLGKFDKYKLPVPMINNPSLDLSFSGLKTAVYYQVKDKNLNKKEILDYCASFEYSAIKELMIKLNKAVEKYKPRMIWVGGGVCSSAKVRNSLRNIAKKNRVNIYFPSVKNIYTDNAAMIGIASLFKYYNKEFSDTSKLDRVPNLTF